MGLFDRNIGPMTNFYPARRRALATAPDVVLVNGFFTSPRSLDVIVDYLEARGLACAVPNLGSLGGAWQTGRVGPAGRMLAAYLASLPVGARPWLIGHSIGGMIARHAVQLDRAAPRVKGVMTLGSPHRGTPVALLGVLLGILSRAPMDITPLSKQIRRLNGARWPTGLPLLSIVSTADLLCPVRFGRAELPGVDDIRNIVLEGLGHTEMVRTNYVLDAIVRLMEDPDAPVYAIG